MANLETNYLGIKLKNPLVVGACSLSKNIDTIKQIEAAGAGGLVIKSLFEEQVQLERASFEKELGQYDALYAEAVDIFPKIEHGGPKEHLFWVSEAKKAVKIPLFASLNAVTQEVWVDYARRLAETGVDGLELNFYSPPLSPDRSGHDLEQQELETFSKVREAVKIPLAVKLHPYYTNIFHLARAFDSRGAEPDGELGVEVPGIEPGRAGVGGLGPLVVAEVLVRLSDADVGDGERRVLVEQCFEGADRVGVPPLGDHRLRLVGPDRLFGAGTADVDHRPRRRRKRCVHDLGGGLVAGAPADPDRDHGDQARHDGHSRSGGHPAASARGGASSTSVGSIGCREPTLAAVRG